MARCVVVTALVAAWCLYPVHGLPSAFIVGSTRVQLLSPNLLRVEPRGPQGFEDRKTFMVQNRDYASITFENETKPDGSTKISTAHYSVTLAAEGSYPGGFIVCDKKGNEIYKSASDTNAKKNLLHWPSPNTASSYAVTDSPRFAVPDWTVSPCCPDGSEVAENLKSTNGYDFGNDVTGDVYVFLLGHGLEGWNAAREEFAKLTGPVPVLPDWAWGSWFTWWHFYDEALAKAEVSNWTSHKVPLDVWGLDMNWRFTEGGQDQAYDHPNTSAFPDMGEWFGWLKERGIHTYFNDHPFQRGPQTSPAEVSFRWDGLTGWLEKGLSFWWFDHNWKFSIAPPNGVTPGASPTFWKGLSTTAWGSHVYWEATDHYNRYSRPDDLFAGGRTIALSMTTPHNEISGYNLGNPLHTGSYAPDIDSKMVAEIPGHHRYPVWWNGDFSTMNNDLEMMVDAGVHDFKPYVHPDCGGDGWFKSVGSLLRQTQMCSFGTVLRFHGGPHQPWIYGSWWEGVVRKYIVYRYKMLPMLIAAGYRANKDGFPFVARSDLYWPGVGNSQTLNHQYVFLDDIVVAPIWDAKNDSSRKVWIPPGRWMDVWNGEVAAGPKEITTSQPWERQPMWVRKDGGLLIMTDKPGLRVAEGDWSTLTLEAYPCLGTCTKERTIYERTDEIDPNPSTTKVSLATVGGDVTITLGVNTGSLPRAWVVRVNLNPGEDVCNATLDGVLVEPSMILARETDDGTPWQGYWPWKGKDSLPPSKAGPVAQFSIASSAVAHVLTVAVAKSVMGCAWDGDDCRSSSCCKVTGSKCYAKSKFWATCKKECTAGVSADSHDGEPWSCKVLGGKPEMVPAKPAAATEEIAGMSLFCISVDMPLVQWQKPLRDLHKSKGYGLCSCDASKVYNGVSTPAGTLSGFTVIPRTYVDIWHQVQIDGLYLQHDWTVKVDVDAVFVPARLKHHLTLLRPVKDASLYIKNSLEYGIATSLMVFSKAALKMYFASQETCNKSLGNYGEDFYFSACLEAIGVRHMDDQQMIIAVQGPQQCTQASFVEFTSFQQPSYWEACYLQAVKTVRLLGARSIAGFELPATAVEDYSSSRSSRVLGLLFTCITLGAASAFTVLLFRRSRWIARAGISDGKHRSGPALLPQDDPTAALE